MASITLSRRNLAGWVTGNVSSLFGFAALELTLTWAAISAASATAVGLTLVAFAVPQIVLAPIGGVLADRVNPKAVLVAVDAARAVLTLVIMILTIAGLESLPVLVAYAIGVGALSGIFEPAVNAFPTRILPRSEMGRIGPIQTIAGRVTLLGAPAAGAVIGWVDLAAAFGMCAGLFLLSSLALSVVRLLASTDSAQDRRSRTRPAAGIKIFGADIHDGLKLVAGRPALLWTLTLALVANLGFSGPVTVGIPLLSKNAHWGPAASGALLGTFAVGAALMATALLRLRRVPHAGLVVLPAVLGQGIALILIGFSSAFVVALAATVLLGLVSGLGGSISRSLLITNSPPSGAGRVMAMHSLSQNGIAPVSYALAGVVLSHSSVLITFVSGGAVVIAITLISATRRVLRTAEIIVDPAATK